MLYRLSVDFPSAGRREEDELRVLEWHHAEGQLVPAGSLVVELETSKAVIECCIKSPLWLRQILVRDGEWLKLRAPAAVLSDSADEPISGDPSTFADANANVTEG